MATGAVAQHYEYPKTVVREEWSTVPSQNIEIDLANGSYLTVVDGINSTSEGTTDVYIISAHNNGHIVKVKDAGAGNHRATLAISARTLTITPLSTYSRVLIVML